MKIERLKYNVHPRPNNEVQLKKMGNISEVKYIMNQSGGNIQKMDKDKYVVVSTGEVKEFKHTESRAENKTSVAQSLKNLRDLINTNVVNPGFCKWVTLTYRENMENPKRLYDDFRKFNSRLTYYFINNNFLPYNYIVAMEPQGRGAWHAHMIMVFDQKAPYIPNYILAKIWGHGFVNVKSLKNVDNVGLYLTAYLGDMELTDALRVNPEIKNAVIKETEISDAQCNKSKKYYIKGARLTLYPRGFRLFRKSKGIKSPIIQNCPESEAMQEIGSARLTYEKTIKICDGDEVVNIINYRQFNSKANPLK